MPGVQEFQDLWDNRHGLLLGHKMTAFGDGDQVRGGDILLEFLGNACAEKDDVFRPQGKGRRDL